MRVISRVLYYGFARYLPPSTFPGGRLWKAIRYHLCRRLFRSCGRNVNIESGARFGSGSKLTIGDNSGIGERAFIVGEVAIGPNVMMGPEVMVWARSHEASDCDTPMLEQGERLERPIRIQEDVSIGARAILLPGVMIGRGAVIGAGSVVAGAVPEWAVVVGNPAKVMRFRNDGKRRTTGPRDTAGPPATLDVSAVSEAAN